MDEATPAVCPECGCVTEKLVRTVCQRCYLQHWKRGTHRMLPLRPPMPPVTEKACRICGDVKLLSEFPARGRGRGSYCSPCKRERYDIPKAAEHRQAPPILDGELTCRVCGDTKPVHEFDWRFDSGKYRLRCKDCRRSYERAKHEADPSLRRKSQIRIKYGLTLDEFDAMVAVQGGGCAICGATENPDAMALAVDHCHATGRIRGILCGPCNKAIGLLRDDPRLLRKAVTYLEER